MIKSVNSDTLSTNIHRVVVPFYLYASVCYLAGCILLFTSADSFKGHYFNPDLLAITHIMALGWATMMILGASYQLLPVLAGSDLFSTALAHISFWLTGTGIPLLVYSFYLFRFDGLTIAGALAINLGIIAYLINMLFTFSRSKQQDIRSLFMITATMWLLATTLIGLLLVINFTVPLLDKDSLHYLNLHAHMGIAGWFLLLVTGIGSKLIPMFLISKYDEPVKLKWIYLTINIALITFIVLFIIEVRATFFLIPVLLITTALALFIRYCIMAYKERIRKQPDDQLKLSFIAVSITVIPLFLLLTLIVFPLEKVSPLPMLYGFIIFFGWLTSIITGMTFKTLPFIIWNKLYQDTAWKGNTPDPKDLFSKKAFSIMSATYLCGFILFSAGILSSETVLLITASAVLILSAVFYNFLVIQLILHKKQLI